MSLTLDDIQHNCWVLADYSHANVSPESDRRLTGFSNAAVFKKSFRAISKNFFPERRLEAKTELIVVKTLEGISKLFESTSPDNCPVFFCNRKGVFRGLFSTTITYEWVAKRLIHGVTFKNCDEIQKKAREVLQIFNQHTFGIVQSNLSSKLINTLSPSMVESLKRNLITHVLTVINNNASRWESQIRRILIVGPTIEHQSSENLEWLELDFSNEPIGIDISESSNSQSENVSALQKRSELLFKNSLRMTVFKADPLVVLIKCD